MLHLAIIGIVCAVSAPIIGRKNYGSDAFCNLDDGARKEPKPLSPPVYNVDAHNSSVFAKQKITNRTNCFHCDYTNKQYQRSRSSSYSVMENVLSRKKKESYRLDVGLGFRKRSLLWRENKLSPKTLRPPMNAENECEKAAHNDLGSEPYKCCKSNCQKLKGRCKRPRCRNKKKKLKCSLRPQTYNLNCCQKKKFLRLKKLSGKMHKRHLDKVKIDDELDLNKRIQKLVQEIAVENQRAAQTGSADESAGADACSGEKTAKKKHKSFQFLKKLKKLFRFNKNKNDCNNKQNNIDNPNSVPVNTVRGKVPVADNTAHLSSYDVFKTMGKAVRFRRNPYRNYVSCSQHAYPVFRNRVNLVAGKPHSFSNNFKKEAKILYPQYRERIFTEVRRTNRLLYGPRLGVQPWPHSKQFVFMPYAKDVRSKRHNAVREKSQSNGDAVFEGSGAAQSGRKVAHSEEEIITTETDDLENAKDKSLSPAPHNLRTTNYEDLIPEHSLEKPFLEKHFNYDFLKEGGARADLKTFEERYNLQTEFPLFDNPTALHPYRRYKYDLPKDEFLNPYRYLKIRHALRSFLIHNNIMTPMRLDSFNEREKRCDAGKCCPLPHKCWRSPPLLCIPYIRKGQDDLLRYLIRTMQKMIGKPFPPKIDIFENTKYKPCGKMVDHPCEDINSDDETCECMSINLPPPCMSMPSCPPPPPPSASRTCPCPIDSPSKLCPCSQPLLTIPRPCPTAPYSPSGRPFPSGQRVSPYANYNPPCDYPPTANAYPSPYQHFYDNMEQVPYPSQGYCGYDEPVPVVPLPCLSTNPYIRSLLPSTSSPIRSLSEPSPRSSTDYPPTPPPFFRASEQTPAAVTRPAYSSPSTANACSWYMSKSPVERAEYFAYTALPYVGPPECVSASFQPAQSESTNPQPPCMRPNAQANQPNPQKFIVQSGPAYVSHPPAPVVPGMNSQPVTERFSYENQFKDRRKSFGGAKQSDEGNAEQMSQIRKEARVGNFNPNPQVAVTCEDQTPRLPENQILKPEMSSGYYGNGNKENFQNGYRFDQQAALSYQQLHKPEANNEYGRPPLSKEENPQVVHNAHPMPSSEGSYGDNKNQNREYEYKCGNQQYMLNEPQITKPEANVKESKPPNKEEAFRCTDQQQHISNQRQQLPKPDINDDNDDKRFFKIKHHKGILKNFRKPGIESLQPYDDYYDRYPFADSEDLSGFKYSKSPFMRPWRGYSRNSKKSSKRGSSIRKKRGDSYDAWPDGLENYNDYDSDVGYSDDSPNDSKTSDEAPSDPNWRPPSYEMFSELAKAVTDISSNLSSSTIHTANKSSPSLGDVAEQMDDKIKTKIPKVNTSTPLNLIESDSCKSVECKTEGDVNTTANNTTVAKTPGASDTTSVSNAKPSNATTPATTTSITHECDEVNGGSMDSKKSGKTGFFQTISKTAGIQSNPGYLTTTKAPKMGSARVDKELDGDQDLDNAEEGQIPTTLKMASIVKGPKKQFTKPCPKVYTKVYPDSIAMETEGNETAATTAVTTAKAVVEKTTLATGSTSDIQVQLLAVCEGYLEVVKLIKAQNQTLGDDLDADLARYCENIISQNFNLQSDTTKPKKQESVQSPPAATTETIRTSAKCDSKPEKKSQDASISNNEMIEPEQRGKVVVDILNNALNKRELSLLKKQNPGRKKSAGSEDNNEEIDVSVRKEKPQLKRKKNSKTKKSYSSDRPNCGSLPKSPKRYRRKEQSEEELLKKGITKEQVELLHLLRKRKRALLSWLYSSKEVPNKASDTQETEYFEDEDEVGRGSDIPSYSGTITLKEYEEPSTTTEARHREQSFLNESIFPVYAKEYGYDRGGELMEVEVLWRKINEKTHEKKIFRNRSVLALLLTSTSEPNANQEDTRLLANGFENEDVSEIQSKNENKLGYADPVANFKKKTSTVPTTTKTKNSSSANNTFTYIKPDPSSIVGAPPNVTKLHPNSSHKISHKFGVAKDLFQEYTLEFLNYAVYILPIMFTILFVFCCLCCAVQILKSKGSTKKHKQKKKRQLSTEDSDTTEDSEPKKKRREARRKKHCKDNSGNLEKKRSRTFWNVLKLNAAKDDDNQTEKKRSFLRFLRGRRDECKAGFSASYSPVREVDEHDDAKHSHDSDIQYHDTRRRKDDNPKTYSQSEAEERRELIALLEELKKIETENTAEKKEVKSVHVQYMTQEDDTPVFQRPEFAFPYQKNVFGMPKGYSPCNKHFPFYRSDPATMRDYELFEDVNELTELLPCDCSYYSKRNEYLRRCDFKINEEGGCKSLIKIFRDAGVTRSKPFREKNLFKNESENRSFIFNKYRGISTDTSDELMGVTQKNAGTEVRLTDNVYETASPFKLPSKDNADFVEEMDSLKHELKNKKHVQLKDDGVLCRL